MTVLRKKTGGRLAACVGEGRARLAELFEAAHGDENTHKRAFAAPVWIAIGMDPAPAPTARCR